MNTQHSIARRLAGALSLLLTACGGSGGATATDGSTTDATTTMNTTVEPTSTTTLDPTSTTLAPTTTSDTSGTDGESATGTSTGTTDEGTSSTTASLETSTGEGTTTDATTGEAVVPGTFGACPGGDADACPASDPLCIVEEGPGGFMPGGSFSVTWSFCTRECEVDADCVSGLDGGAAKARCVETGNNMVKVCVLDCGFGQSCPDAVECSNSDHCGTRLCDCQGTGCDDVLCTG